MSKTCLVYPSVVEQLINQYKDYESIIKASYIYLINAKPDFSITDLLNEINESLTEESLEQIKLPIINRISTYEYNLAVNSFSFSVLRTFYKEFENFNFPEIEGINNDYIENLLDQFIVELDKGENDIIKENRKLLKEEILKDRNAFKLRALNVIKDLRLVDINLDEDKDQLTVEASKDKTQDIKNDLGVSVNDKVSTKIKLAILLSSHSQDIVFGLSYPNNYKLITQYIANSLANLNTLDEMTIKLSEINNPLINPFKEYLKLNKPATTLEEVYFRLEFFKAFNSNKKNFFQTNYQNTKEETSVSIVYQSDLGLSNSIKEKWKNNFTRKYNGIRFTKELVDNINSLLKSKKSDETKSLELFKLLGIELNEATINIVNNDDYLDRKEEIIHPEAYYFSNLSYSNFISVFERTYKSILEKNKSEEDISNIISIFQKSSPLTYYIDAIANHQIIYETAIAEQSILNGNGDRVYALQLNDFISNLFNKINYTLKKVANYSNENKNKELQKIVPELDSSLDKVFNLFVFNKLKGNKLKEIKIFNSSELVNLSNPTESISLSRQKPQDIIINYFKSISFGHFPIPRAADRGYDTFITFIEKNGTNMFPINYSSNVEEMKKSFIYEMNNLLKYELYTRKKYLEIKESGIQLVYSGENQGLEDLRFFKNLNQTVKDKIFKININDIGDINLNSYPEINEFINSLIEEIYRDQNDLFINNGLIKDKSLLISNLIKEKNVSTESTIYYLSLNNAVMQSQLFPLIFGDVAQFKNTEDIIKRIKLYNSTRQNVETSHLFEYLSIIDNKTSFETDLKGEKINVKLSKYESPRDKRFIGQVNYSRDKVISYITKDNNIELSQEEIDIINKNMLDYISNISGIEVDKLSEKVKTYVKNQAELYKKINSTDAFALVTLDFYRDLRFLSNNWQINDEISFRLQNKENLSDREKELINLGSFEILKTQALGRLLNTELLDLKVISGYKHAIMPLVPQFIKGTTLEQLNEKLVKEGIDIIQTESANKFGTILFGKDSPKLPDFPNSDNIKDISINNTQITNISDFGIQQDTTPKPEDFVTAAKQFRGIVLNNLYKNGKLINENNKQKVDNYEDSQRELTDYLVAELLEKMGLSDEIDINKFVDFIKNKAQVSDTNFLESLAQIKKGLPLEAIQNLGKVVSQILSEPRKATVNQKVPGMTGILASSTGFKITNKEVDSKLKRLRIENGRVLPGEIHITIPKAFESVLENKYNNNLDELNKAIENSVEAWYKDPNAKTEIPIELLQIIGFRIPNQAFSSNEYLIVTKFLPRNSGGVAIAYEEITLKTGSDFDVDKLTMYLPSFSFLNGKILITSNKEGKLSDETINLIVDQKINEIENVKNRKYRKAISTTILIRKQLKEELERKFGGFVDDELLADIEEFQKNKEKIKAKLFIDIKKEYLYNNLFFAQLDLLTIPEQFGNFFNPVSDILLKGAVKSLKKETPKFNYTELLKANHHIKLTLEFLEGKNLLGVVANAIRNHILSQKANIIGVNKVNKTLPLFLFNHNTQELSIIEGETSQLTSYADTTTKNNFPILSLLSEFLTAYVDIAKDSYIFRLNMTSMVINQVIAMIRAGVNMGDTIKLMNQPIIDEYLKLTSFNESEFAKSNFLDKDNDDVIKDVFNSKGQVGYFNKSLYYYYKKNKTKEFTQKFLAYQQEIKNNPKLFEDTNNKYYQSIILDIFLYQNLVSKPISNLSRIFKDDSIGFKSLDEIYNQEQEFSKLIEEGELLNLENLKYDSILSSFITNNSIIKNKLANFYLVFSPEYINTYDNVVNTFKEKIGSDPARISRVVKDRIFDYIIQNFYSKVFPDDVLPINSTSKNNLFSKENGLYKEILEITKPESTHPLKNNTVLNSFIIEDREVTMNLKQQNNNQIDTNKQFYIDSFNEIVKTEPQLADRIFKFAMLQSGKVISDFNFIDIIPADMYYNKVVPIIDYFLQSKAMLNSQEIVKLIAKAHPELLPVLKRTSLVYIKESKKYEYLKDSSGFIKFIEENKSEYPEITNYINNYKGFIKRLKQLNITVDNKLLVVTPIKTSDYKIYDSEVKVGYATVRQPVYNEKYTKIYKELQELRDNKRENQDKIKELEEIMKSATVIYYSYKIYQAVYNYQLSTEKESIYDFIQIGNNSDGRYFVDMTASESISDIPNFMPVDEIKTEPQAPVSTGFQGYKGGFEDVGKGTPQGDGKDIAMRRYALNGGVIVELSSLNPSSSLTSFNTIEPFGNPKVGTNAFIGGTTKRIVLARNKEFSGKPLNSETKEAIAKAYNQGYEFVVGDMPNVDSQFIDYLQEIGAKFTIYHTDNKKYWTDKNQPENIGKPRINISKPTIPRVAPITAEQIYSQLGDRTFSGNVTKEKWNVLEKETKAINPNYIVSTRIKNTENHFGNFYSSIDSSAVNTEISKMKEKGTYDNELKRVGGKERDLRIKILQSRKLIPTETTQESVEKYINWILTGETGIVIYDNTTPDSTDLDFRREWILEQLESGSLKGKPIKYFTEIGEPSHATALDYLINKYDWSKPTTPTVTTEVETLVELQNDSLDNKLVNFINSLIPGYIKSTKDKLNIVAELASLRALSFEPNTNKELIDGGKMAEKLLKNYTPKELKEENRETLDNMIANVVLGKLAESGLSEQDIWYNLFDKNKSTVTTEVKLTQPTVSSQDTTKDDIDIKKLKDFYVSLTKENQFKLGILDELELDYLNKPDRNIDNYIDSLKCKL